MEYTKNQLKRFTLSRSLFSTTTLKSAVQKLSFVQIDPIRFPAPAQDLILRHRVKDYHVGDIDRLAPSLGLEEDFLYAHGYLTQDVWGLLHPREKVELTDFDKQVYETVRKMGSFHPKELEKHFDKAREINWWGGYSRSSKMALDRLHYYGLLRIVGRQGGNRLYEAFSSKHVAIPIEERLKKIVMAMVQIMAPVSSKNLSQSMHRIHRQYGNTRPIIKSLVESGELEMHVVDGMTYLWPKGVLKESEVSPSVKFLAPFDPVVRDRFRFEHLWGWLYQFEAYVPAAKRIRGYYAMPILFGEEMVGWANVKRKDSGLDVDVGFVHGRPKSKQFESELEMEIERMKKFLEKDKE